MEKMQKMYSPQMFQYEAFDESPFLGIREIKKAISFTNVKEASMLNWKH